MNTGSGVTDHWRSARDDRIGGTVSLPLGRVSRGRDFQIRLLRRCVAPLLNSVHDFVCEEMERSRITGRKLARAEINVLTNSVGSGANRLGRSGGFAAGMNADPWEVLAYSVLKAPPNGMRQWLPAGGRGACNGSLGTVSDSVRFAPVQMVGPARQQPLDGSIAYQSLKSQDIGWPGCTPWPT
jgi:hypothetical protein